MYDLFEVGVVLLPNVVVVDGEMVSWAAPTREGKFVDFLEHSTIGTYRRWAVGGEYSAMLTDGSLLQMTYKIAGGRIVGHRLAYVPCPYRMDQELLQTEPVSDVLDLYASQDHTTISMQTVVRFDYDPAATGAGHPSAHLTINTAGCRIACESALSPSHFVRFVFQHFYPKEWRNYSDYFSALTITQAGISTVTTEERADTHVAWRGSGVAS